MKLRVGKIFLLGMALAIALPGCLEDNPRLSATLNRSACLVGELPANPLQWRMITSGVGTADSTMFTIYGNDVAIQYARTRSDRHFSNGSAVAMVTWTQQEDGRWFGAKIPYHVKSVEFVFVAATADGRLSYSYQKFEGTPLKQTSLREEKIPSDRAAELLSRRAAVMP